MVRRSPAVVLVLLLALVAMAAPAVAATPTCRGRAATIVGNSNPNRLRGTHGVDVIVAGPGNDTISGLGGGDVICAGSGDDVVYGGDGNDRIYGDEGADRLGGGNGHDFIRGNAGRDAIYGGYGHDEIHGDGGTDRIIAGAGFDVVDGGKSGDYIHGGYGNDVLRGSDRYRGEDEILGGPGNDRLYGGDWSDRLDGGPGDDLVAGGHGSDLLLDTGGGSDSFHGGDEVDGVVEVDVWYPPASEAVDVNLAAGRALTADGEERLAGVESVRGTAFADVLIGDALDNQLHGGAGDDRIEGRGGNDHLVGGLPEESPKGTNDVVDGGSGDDHVSVFEGAVTGGTGTDLLDFVPLLASAPVSVDLGRGVATARGQTVAVAGVENVQGTYGDDVIIGGSGPNVLYGEEGNDDLAGAGGDDILEGEPHRCTCGSAYSDTLRGNAGDDRLIVINGSAHGGAGTDWFETTLSFESPWSDGGPGRMIVDLTLGTVRVRNHSVEADRDVTISGIENVKGTPVSDTMIGDAGPNIFMGAEQDDDLRGGGGADVILGGADDDDIRGGAGDDRLSGGATLEAHRDPYEGVDTLVGGTGTDVCYETGPYTITEDEYGPVAPSDGPRDTIECEVVHRTPGIE